jgi:hypothetical protein
VEVYLECVRGADPDDSYRSPACRSIAVSGLRQRFSPSDLEPLLLSGVSGKLISGRYED